MRAEYPLAISRLKLAISQAEECGLLGDHILGTDFHSISISIAEREHLSAEREVH